MPNIRLVHSFVVCCSDTYNFQMFSTGVFHLRSDELVPVDVSRLPNGPESPRDEYLGRYYSTASVSRHVCRLTAELMKTLICPRKPKCGFTHGTASVWDRVTRNRQNLIKRELDASRSVIPVSSCVHNWRLDPVRLRFMRAQTRAQAFTKKQFVFRACGVLVF